MMKPWKLTVALAMTGMAVCALPLAAPVSAASAVEAPAPAAQADGRIILAQAHTAPAGGAEQKVLHDIQAAAGESHGGEHGKKSHFPPFDTTTFASQLLWLVLSFGLLYLLMSKVTLPRIGRILEERHDRIADDLEEASKHKAESQAAQAAYEKALNEARTKAASIAGDTRARLAADADANRKALEADLATKLASAEQRIATTKSDALSHVRGIAVDTTNAIVNTLLGAAPAAFDVEKAVDAALAKKDAA